MSSSLRPWFLKGVSKMTAQNCLGEVIYFRVHPLHPKVAGKITGMILEAKTIKECDALLEDEAAFAAIVAEAIDVLKAHGVQVN